MLPCSRACVFVAQLIPEGSQNCAFLKPDSRLPSALWSHTVEPKASAGLFKVLFFNVPG